MADPDKRADIDKLLAEVESTLGGQPTRAPVARRGGRDAQPVRRGLVAQVRTAAVSGAVAAAVVWVLFALLPFLGSTSGAAGAFLAAFVTVLILRRR